MTTDGNEFLLNLFGFTRVERMTVASVCSLTQRRARGYSVATADRADDAHIVLVDADDLKAREQWRASLACHRGRPALMIGRDANALQGASYSLPRANFAARLVKLLDQIAMHEFRSLPDVMVGDTAPAATVLSAKAISESQTKVGSIESINSAPRSGRARVLVVDDALVVRTQMKALLELHRVEPILAATAEQAMQLMQSHGPFALVLLDVVMPGMDGYTACRKLKNIDRDVPVIMLTGKDSAFDKIRGVMAGCNRYLTKPIAVEALSKVLQEFLEKELPTPQAI